MKKLKCLLVFLLILGLTLPYNVLAEPTTSPSETESPDPSPSPSASPEEPETETFTVTFDTDGGSSVNSQKVEKGKTVAKPSEDPTKDGFTFKEWQLNGKTYTFLEEVTEDITLKAVWVSNEPQKPVPESSYLSSLSLDDYKLSPAFNKDTTTYSVTVPPETKVIKINATPDENSSIVNLDSIGTKTLKDGRNVFTVSTKLKDTNDKVKEYTIVVTRENPDVKLDSLKVDGYALEEAFQSDVYYYTVKIPYEVEEITVRAMANSPYASVEVLNNKNLVVGENTVTVRVTYSTGATQDYTINVLRLKEGEWKETTSNTSSITSTGDVLADSSDENDFGKYIMIVVFAILALLMLGLGIFFFIKSRDPEKIRLKKEKKEAKKKKDEEDSVESTPSEIEKVQEEVPTETVETSPLASQNMSEEDLLEKTIEAPVVDRSDILNDIEDLFDDENK